MTLLFGERHHSIVIYVSGHHLLSTTIVRRGNLSSSTRMYSNSYFPRSSYKITRNSKSQSSRVTNAWEHKTYKNTISCTITFSFCL